MNTQDFNIANGNADTFVDTTPGGGFAIDFTSLDNSFNVQVNGVQLFVGGPNGLPNELQFQQLFLPADSQTVRFPDGSLYGSGGIESIWLIQNDDGSPIIRLEVDPDGSARLFGVRADNGTLEPLELFNGMTVNSAAISAVWDDDDNNTITLGQDTNGATNASGEFEDVPCFASGTLIKTENGMVRVEDLSVGDKVLTYDNGFQPIRWIGSRSLSHAQLQTSPRLKPILIRADALGAGYPSQDLVVSPQHRILVSSAIAKRMFDCKDILLPAKKLLPLTGVEVVNDAPNGVSYFHILLDQHEILWSNGAPTESLFLGPQALSSVNDESRQEILDLFPECLEPDFQALSIRYVPQNGRHIKKLVERHRFNQKPLLCEPLR